MDHTLTRPSSRLGQLLMFVRHFLEMCVVMCIGGGLLNTMAFVAGPALLGYPDLRETTPALALLMIACIFAAPMVGWMRFRGMPWRPTMEMAGATVGLAVVLVGLAGIGVVTETELSSWALGFCGPACVVMLGVMLFRLDLYTGRTGHRTGRAPESVPAA